MARRCIGKIPQNYSFSKIEKRILGAWNKNRIYQKVKQQLKDQKKFYFLDGPPYVTNPPHVGTAWNKILKDSLIRHRRMLGYNVRDQPGYDCHGLPIEVKVEEDLNIKNKREIEESITISKFIEHCKRYAQQNMNIQTKIFKELGVWMDWDNPYLTFKNEYIESVWWVIKRADEKKLLQKGMKVVHWCPRCETALSGYEVTDEYRTIKDQSIYVKFPVEGKDNEFILIWTTTPWTLPANLAIMVNPELDYTKVKVGNETYILAESRRNTILEGHPQEVIDTFKGKKLEGLKYKPPLLEEVIIQSQPELRDTHLIILSKDHVSAEEGTGCVHCAPGHGEEDFDVGQKNRLPVISPVNQAGRFTQEAGKYSGSYVFNANSVIVEDLKFKSLLFKTSTIEHSYPHCWRCKTPLILRATEQWFIKITDLKQRLYEENEKVKWNPEWAGSKRFRDWLLGARDWVISRQRYWGTPMPIWICCECDRRTVIGSEKELRSRARKIGSKIELHRQDVDPIKLSCECGGTMSRIPDIVDVWMDSGASSWACLHYPRDEMEFKKWWPADLIVEAHDQTRGWFYSLLGAGVIAFDETPYKAVLMHGHTFNAKGDKMSKSAGDFISPQEIVKKYGRDSLRFYELQRTIWEDFNFSISTIEETFRDLKVIWNIYAFASIYMNLDSFQPEKYAIEKKTFRQEDIWLLSRTESLKLLVNKEMENLNVHKAARILNKFAVEDLSRWYIKLVRRRFWQEKESLDKLASYSSLYNALKTWLLLSAPFIPFFTEELYQKMIKPSESKPYESIHMSPYPKPNADWIESSLEENMELAKELVGAALSARQTAKIKLRQPISRIIIVTDDPSVKRAVEKLEQIIFSQVNTRKIEFMNIDEGEKFKELKAIPNYKTLGPTFKKEANLVAELIKKLDGRKVFVEIKDRGSYDVEFEGKHYALNSEMIILREEMAENFVPGVFSRGRVYVDVTMPKNLITEGLARDVVRRMQEMRRQMNLPVDAYVNAYLISPREMEKSLIKRKTYIAEEVRIKKLNFIKKRSKKTHVDLWREWLIDGSSYFMGLQRIVKKKSNRSKRSNQRTKRRS